MKKQLEKKEANRKAYQKAVDRQKKIQTRAVRKRMKESAKKAEKYNSKKGATFFEKLFRRKQKKKAA